VNTTPGPQQFQVPSQAWVPREPTTERKTSRKRKKEPAYRIDKPDDMTERQVLEHVISRINQFAWKRKFTREMFFKVYHEAVSVQQACHMTSC